MRNVILAALASGLLALAALLILFGYDNPEVSERKIDQAPVEVADEAPKGYFDLRGNKEILISLQEFDINPEKIVVDRGTKIIWKNEDQLFHRVVSDSLVEGKPLFDSQNIKSEGNFQMTFPDAGTFSYHCSFHAETMKGIIVVDD